MLLWLVGITVLDPGIFLTFKFSIYFCCSKNCINCFELPLLCPGQPASTGLSVEGIKILGEDVHCQFITDNIVITVNYVWIATFQAIDSKWYWAKTSHSFLHAKYPNCACGSMLNGINILLMGFCPLLCLLGPSCLWTVVTTSAKMQLKNMLHIRSICTSSFMSAKIETRLPLLCNCSTWI